MDKIEQFISLFLEVWRNGISGINISEIITENWGLCYKKHKKVGRRIPSKKKVSFSWFSIERN